MTLSPHHKLALLGAAATSAIALTDAITHGVTHDSSAFVDESAHPALIALVGVAHGLTYLALCAVLVREGFRFAGVNRVARGTRLVLVVSLGALSPGYALLTPFVGFTGVEHAAGYAVWEGIATVAFAGLILGSLVLGLALLPSRALGVGASVLALMLPIAALTALVGWLAPAWAHPAYLETTLHVGIALLGVGAAGSVSGGFTVESDPELTLVEVSEGGLAT
jgi:hypothetical protein